VRLNTRATATGLLASAAGVAGGYALLVRGSLTLDLGIGRRLRRLGPATEWIAAPPEIVFDVIAGPYLGRTPRAMQHKLRVLERGADMVVAEHFGKAGPLTVTTVEAVRFERPNRVSFRVLRGPVPHILETYELEPNAEGTRFTYSGEMGTDLWALGRWWGDQVAPPWESVVARSIGEIKAEAERRAAPRGSRASAPG
jgi:Polyketide cyclase / dehydrase and lipid transport